MAWLPFKIGLPGVRVGEQLGARRGPPLTISTRSSAWPTLNNTELCVAHPKQHGARLGVGVFIQSPPSSET
jgi:hypothetical protein